MNSSISDRRDPGGLGNDTYLVYDGACPFCRNYVALMQLRERFPGLALVDARESKDHPAVAAAKASGLLIDDGMVLFDKGKIFHGADAMTALSAHSGSSFLGRTNRVIFSNNRLSRALYPLLRAGRALTLKLIGRKRLDY